jgi:hypothetical protein
MNILEIVLFAERSYSVSWALVLFSIILGMLVTLAPSRRKSEVKKLQKY